ncbi:MAG: hypothetical protein ACK56J_10515 [Planctomycetota bacterium]|jgi:hypothetical protein
MTTQTLSPQQRIADCLKHQLCVACLQPARRGRVIRGCHERCYRATIRAAQAGKCTIEERIAQGKLLYSQPSGRKPSNAVSVELQLKKRRRS